MSYQQQITENINKVISEYINDVSNYFKIDKEELTKLWNNKEIPKKTLNKESETEDPSIRLKKLKKSELENICKEKGLDTKGKKDVIIQRIIQNLSKKDNIIEKITSGIAIITIQKNSFGNYVHQPTSLVFNRQTKTVIGKQQDDGNISELTPEDIELCNQYKFKFKLPTNLNNNDEEDENLEKDILDNSDDEEDDDEEDDDEEDDDE